METRITKLTLQGFKSFRKRVSIPFFEGFNVLCGPNGAGKTNLLDSVCFVLGRTSAKSLRAGRLHELIYHGNKKILASDYASVSLWFDNSNNVFPLETPEISIKRKINKNGVSIYKINGKTTTREKILELLSSARITPEGYNIIMQGDVSQIIEMTPQERRSIIDEISGIAQYNEKKEKAQRNLEIVESKLREVEIILAERMERLQELEADRNIALKYKELRERLETLEASLAKKRFEIEDGKFQDSEDEITRLEEEVQKLESDIRNADKEMGTKEKRKEELVEKMFVRSKEAGIRQEIEDVKNKILRNKDRIESNQREIERINNMIDKLSLLQEGRTGFFSKTVQTILGLKRTGVYGTVGNLIKAKEEYESAVEVAGGFRLQNIIVKDVPTASGCIDFLKKEQIGRATFLPLDRVKFRKPSPEQKDLLKRPGVIGFVTDLIRYEKKYSPAVENVLGNTLVVENLGVARKIGIGKMRMVTLDGDLAERSGVLVGGYYRKRELLGKGTEVEEYEQNRKELEEEINFLRIEIGQLNQKMEELRKKEEKESREVVDVENERIQIDGELEELRTERKGMFEERLRLENQLNRLKIKSARMEAEVNSLKDEVDKHEKVEYIDEKPTILETQIQKTIAILNSLGLVNMKAIEEYDEFKGEFDKLKGKYDEIRKEKQAVVDMIEKIEEKRKEVFYECLRGIDRNFRRVFKKIAGGNASLELENPLDIESGMFIQANPAGKNMLNIDSMSGGEKALTALAFLFGVQKYKPAPFYVLDEVDAFLDKVNTKKIVEMIKELSQKEQFIIITHNDYTIKQGDKVYGVSMSNGESKILGIELPEAG